MYPVFTFIPDIWVTTQKKLSFTWDTIIAPEQRAVTRIAFSRGETNPITPIRGATMDAVVMMDTVEDPWAVLSAKAIRNGSHMPRLYLERASPSTSAIPESRRIIPKDPPAAVIRMMMAAEDRDLPTHPVVESISLSNFFGRVKDSTIPMSRATTGSPMKLITVAKVPLPKGSEGKDATDFSTMSTRGMTTGRKDFVADGACATFSTMSASLSLGAGSM